MPHLALIAGTYCPNRCGVADYTHRLRAALAERGRKSIVLTTRAAATADSSVIGVVEDWRLQDLPPLVRAVHQSQVDALHIQHAAGTYGFQRAIFLLPLLLRLSGWRAPIITTVHEYGWWEWQPRGIPPAWLEFLKEWGQRQGWWDREDGFLLTQSDALITTNPTAEAVILDRLPQLQSRLHHVPIAANVEIVSGDWAEVRATARQLLCQQYGWSPESQIIAFFGFLHPVKGLETLLPAFRQVLATHPAARLLLIGGVESLALRGEEAACYDQHLRQHIVDLQLGSTVQMTGYLEPEQVSRYLSAADLGVLPFNHGVTLKSGSLLTLFAHRLPVIATVATPPDPELTDSLIYPVPCRDVEQLATALQTLLSDSPRRNLYATAGKCFSRAFAWDAIADAHCRIYDSLL
ncbi:MAG: glycosyltransferase [Synechococcales cyanobacterium C42_A2020_086]|nr:glycosyltransferase [Synechococcales cyanobacterium C42_A2020_086]